MTINFKTNPYKAVEYNSNAIMKAAEVAGSLIADIKYDGVRLNVVVNEEAESVFLSRTSKTVPALEHLNGFDTRWNKFLSDDRQIYPQGLMIDGEAMVKGVDFHTSGGILRSKWVNKKNVKFTSKPDFKMVKGLGKIPFELDPSNLKVVVYAVLPLNVVESGEDYNVMNCLMQEHAKVTVSLLQEYFPEIDWVIPESHDVFSIDQLEMLYEYVREQGQEGLVVKDPLGFYKRGKKTGWWKMKPENEADGTIIGLVWGTKGKANDGKVIGFEVLLENGKTVRATNISQELMEEFTGNVLTHTGMFNKDEYVENYAGASYYEGWACQITYMEVTPDGSLRHPSFVCFRGTEDKPEEKI